MDFCIHVFKRVMEAVNNVDVGEFGAGSLPGIDRFHGRHHFLKSKTKELESFYPHQYKKGKFVSICNFKAQ